MAARRDKPLVPGYTNAYVRSVLSGRRPCPYILAERLVAHGYRWSDLQNRSPATLVDANKTKIHDSREQKTPATRDGDGAVANATSSTNAPATKSPTKKRPGKRG